MKWQKMGLLYRPSGKWWSKSHAYCPTPEVIDEDRILRVYFSSWDRNWVGRIGYVDFDVSDLTRIRYVTESKKPILDVGEAGTFDADGVAPSYLLNIGSKKLLYYFGFQRTSVKDVTLILAGLATSNDRGVFVKVSKTPLLERTDNETFLRSSVSVLRTAGIYEIWYTSTMSGWKPIDTGGLLSKTSYPKYSISYKQQFLYNLWDAHGARCIFLHDDEFGIGRPWVIKEDNIYKMWYSVRSKKIAYKIGYAESDDGFHWVRRDDKCGLLPSKSGWDSEMVCFGTVVDFGNGRIMIYNGNKHGKEGFGYALWKE